MKLFTHISGKSCTVTATFVLSPTFTVDCQRLELFIHNNKGTRSIKPNPSNVASIYSRDNFLQIYKTYTNTNISIYLQVLCELMNTENELQVASLNSERSEIQYSLTPPIKNTPNYQNSLVFKTKFKGP